MNLFWKKTIKLKRIGASLWAIAFMYIVLVSVLHIIYAIYISFFENFKLLEIANIIFTSFAYWFIPFIVLFIIGDWCLLIYERKELNEYK